MSRVEQGVYAFAFLGLAAAVVTVFAPVERDGTSSDPAAHPAAPAIAALDQARQTELDRLAQSYSIAPAFAVDAQVNPGNPPKLLAVATIHGRSLAYVGQGERVARLAIGQSAEGWRLVGVTANSATFVSGTQRVAVRLFRRERPAGEGGAAGAADDDETSSSN